MNMQNIGRWAFIIGLVISVIAGFFSIGLYGLAGLVILGIIVGILNVTGEEVNKFLLGTIALILVGTSLNYTLGTTMPIINNILNAFVTFIAGAALIVALKEVYAVTKNK